MEGEVLGLDGPPVEERPRRELCPSRARGRRENERRGDHAKRQRGAFRSRRRRSSHSSSHVPGMMNNGVRNTPSSVLSQINAM